MVSRNQIQNTSQTKLIFLENNVVLSHLTANAMWSMMMSQIPGSGGRSLGFGSHSCCALGGKQECGAQHHSRNFSAEAHSIRRWFGAAAAAARSNSTSSSAQGCRKAASSIPPTEPLRTPKHMSLYSSAHLITGDPITFCCRASPPHPAVVHAFSCCCRALRLLSCCCRAYPAVKMESSQRSSGSNDCCAVKRRRIVTDEDYKASDGLQSFFGQPPFSNLVFTPLSDAITTWERSEEAKTRRKINVLTTVVTWGPLKQTKGMHTSPVAYIVFKDMHVSARLSDAYRTIKASSFFDMKEIPKKPVVGEKVRLHQSFLLLRHEGNPQKIVSQTDHCGCRHSLGSSR